MFCSETVSPVIHVDAPMIYAPPTTTLLQTNHPPVETMLPDDDSFPQQKMINEYPCCWMWSYCFSSMPYTFII